MNTRVVHVTALVVGAVLLVAIAIVLIILFMSRPNSAGLTTSFGSDVLKFGVDFPAAPKATNNAMTVQGTTVPYITYQANTNSNKISYVVTIYRYSIAGFTFSDNDKRNLLETDIKGLEQTGYENLEDSSNNGHFYGYPSADAIYNSKTTDADGNTTTTYVKAFVRGNDLYDVKVSGLSQDSYMAFVNTFQFVGDDK